MRRLPWIALAALAPVYGSLHALLLWRLERADAERAVRLGHALPAPSLLEWLPVGSSLRAVALAGLALALVRSGRRGSALLPALVLVAGTTWSSPWPTPLDGAWGDMLFLGRTGEPPLLLPWLGTALDAALVLTPALLALLGRPKQPVAPGLVTTPPVVPVLVVLARCAPGLVVIVLVERWSAMASGAALTGYLEAALLVVGAGLLAAGALPPRRVFLLLLGLVPLAAPALPDLVAYPSSAGLTGCLAAACLALTSAAWALALPALVRRQAVA